PCVPQQLRWLLGAALAAALGTALAASVLLLGLHLAGAHAETVLRMSIEGLRGDGPPRELPVRRTEATGTFAVRDGLNSSAMLVYDYGKVRGGGAAVRAGTAPGAEPTGSICQQLLISYRSWRHPACYVTRMDQDSVQGLDAVTAAFRRRQAEQQQSGARAEPLGDRTLLGTTASVLCSTVPVYWA
ncbi:PSPC protein, partial [Eudromia elegans]|nr:PSPC protein [Eudromia elegans]